MARWTTGWRGGALLVLVCLAVYLPGWAALPPVDRDESRFAQASRQMVESGDWIVPRVKDRPRINKPPMIYWLQSGAVLGATGGEPRRDAIWMYRVPSLVGVIIAVLATWRLAMAMGLGGGARRAWVPWLAGAMLALCPLVWWEARQARADMALLACTTLALWAAWVVVRPARGAGSGAAVDGNDGKGAGPGWGVMLGLWLAVAAGVLVKGPITPMVVAFALVGSALLERSWRPIAASRWWVGVILVLATAGPWAWLVSREVGAETYLRTIHAEVLGRSMEPKEGHGGPPGYHLVAVLLLAFPGCMVFGWAFVRAAWSVARATRARWSRGAARGGGSFGPERFILAALFPSWIVFEVVSTKLPHYTLPLYPLLAILAARMLSRPVVMRRYARSVVGRGLLGAYVAGLGVMVLGFAGVAAWIGWQGVGMWAGVAAAVWGAGVWGVSTWWVVRAWRGARWGMMQGVGLAGFAAMAPVVGVLAPWAPHWLTRDAAAALARVEGEVVAGPRIGDVSLREDSMVFHSRGRIRHVETFGIAEFLAEHPGAVLIVDPAVGRDLPGWTPRAVVRGFNYSTGDWMTVEIGTVRPTDARPVEVEP